MSGKLKLKSNLSKIDSKKSVKCLLKFKSKAFFERTRQRPNLFIKRSYLKVSKRSY